MLDNIASGDSEMGKGDEKMGNEPEQISAMLDDLTCELIGICLDALAADGEVYPMLAYVSDQEDMQCFTFDDDSPDECLDAAREQVGLLESDVVAYAIAYDGFVQIDESGETQDALLVEFGERGAQTAYSAYVPYQRGTKPGELFTGNPEPAGEEPLLLG